jgi:hypothetical protein
VANPIFEALKELCEAVEARLDAAAARLTPTTTADALSPVEPAPQAPQGVTVHALVRVLSHATADAAGAAYVLWDHPRIGPLLRGEGAPVQSPDPHEALAARPLLEQVAHLADRIGQHTVSEITVISDRAAAWLAENPPGRPVAIEPRGCPTPGSCSCVEPPAPAPAADGEREELIQWLDCFHEYAYELGRPDWGHMTTRAAALLRQPAPAPVPVAERPWERPGWCDAEGECWWRGRRDPAWWTAADPRMVHDGWLLPHWAIPIPQPPQGGEVA